MSSTQNQIQAGAPKDETKGSKAMIAIVLVTSLFLIWGVTMNLVNPLRDPFGQYMHLSATQTSLLQFAYYIAYFVMAIPAGLIAKRFGYKGGMISGLILFAIGAFLAIPATNMGSYGLFLFAMFVVALGASSLETNANPYITKLGDEEHESFRLNLAQSFNAVGNVISPILLGFIVPATIHPDNATEKTGFLNSIQMVYIVIGIVLVVVLAAFAFIKLPQPPGDVEEEASAASAAPAESPLKKPYVILGIIAEFIFIGLQVVGMGLFTTYAQQFGGMNSSAALIWFTVLTVCFAAGRFITTPIMSRIDPGKILFVYMTLSAILMLITAAGWGMFSVVCFVVAYLFISIGYPTIFSLTIKGLHGQATKTVSSALVMSIVGAALIPLLFGVIQDGVGGAAGLQVALLVTVPCFAYLAWYAIKGSKMGLSEGK
jgi:FHS family L-fucose permease-like MFS transporter